MIKIRLEYYDHNESFASCLPQLGQISETFSSTDGSTNWHLVKLNNSISYQIKIGEPFQFKLIETDNVLIRSRWEEQDVGEAEPTSVFILLVDPSQLPLSNPIEIKEFYHVAWGMSHTLSNNKE